MGYHTSGLYAMGQTEHLSYPIDRIWEVTQCPSSISYIPASRKNIKLLIIKMTNTFTYLLKILFNHACHTQHICKNTMG